VLAACLSRSSLRASAARSAAMSDWSSGYDPGHPGLPSGAQGFPPQMGGAWLLGQPARGQHAHANAAKLLGFAQSAASAAALQPDGACARQACCRSSRRAWAWVCP
jgi:hypothetical protein